MHMVVGMATTVWGKVEILIQDAFVQAVDPTGIGSGAAARAFWEVVSFKGKLDMTNAAMRHTMKTMPHLQARWTNLYNRAIRESKKRNELAHGEVMRESKNNNSGTITTEIVFRPYWFKETFKGQDSRDYEPLKRTAQEIVEFITKLSTLTRDLKVFLSDLRAEQLESLPEQLERRLDSAKSRVRRPTTPPEEPSQA